MRELVCPKCYLKRHGFGWEKSSHLVQKNATRHSDSELPPVVDLSDISEELEFSLSHDGQFSKN